MGGHTFIGSHLLAVDGLSSSSVPPGEIPTLAHELRDDPVEAAPLEVQGLPRASGPLLAGAEGAEVLGCLGDDVGTEGHLNATGGGAADGDVEEYYGVGHGFFNFAVEVVELIRHELRR